MVNTLRAGLEGVGLEPSACDELIAAVPAVLVIDADDGGTIAGIVARAGALRDALPTANLAKLCGKRPEFLVTKDRGEYRLTYESEPRVGHAAGMPVGEKRGDEKSAPGDGDGGRGSGAGTAMARVLVRVQVREADAGADAKRLRRGQVTD